VGRPPSDGDELLGDPVQWVIEFSAGSAVLAGVPSPSAASTTTAATVRMALIMVPPSKEPLC